AAVFHSMRATESAARDYWCRLTQDALPEPPQLKKLIDGLKGHGANPKVLAALDQIRDLHRNPIMHPDVRIDLSEALAVWLSTSSAIIAIVQDATRAGD